MSKRLVTILWGIAGLLAALTLLVKSSQSGGNDEPVNIAQGSVLLKDLPLKEVATIKIEDAENTATLKKEATQWSLSERSDYKVDFAKLTRLLRSLTEVSVAQSKKAGPAFNARFGMDPEAENQEDHGYQLSFLDSKGGEIQTLSIGKETSNEGPGAAGKYIRLGNEPEAIYAVNESFFDLTADPTAWMSNEFISINGIKSIALEPAEEDTINGWTVSRSNAGSDFTVQNLKDGRQPQADKLTPMKNVLSSPRFEDVLTAAQAQEQRNESKARQLTITTFDGLSYLLDYAPPKAVEQEGEDGTPVTTGYIMKVTVTADLPAEREKKDGESEEDAKKADAAFVAKQKELKERLAKEQAFGDFYYRVADYTLSAPNIGRDAIAKPVVKTEAISPTMAQPQLGPLAPQPPIGQAPPEPEAPRRSAVSPPIAVPPTPARPAEPKAEPAAVEAKEEPVPEVKPANNSDALSILSEDDIKRIVEETKAAETTTEKQEE